MALSGMALGGTASYRAGVNAGLAAAQSYAGLLDLRSAPELGESPAFANRAAMIEKALKSDSLERLPPPQFIAGPPRIILIFDDMGLDREAFEHVMHLPGPVTLSFLPYAKGVQPMVDRARARGDAIMLHLPMQPEGAANPGPHALRTDMTATSLLSELDWNLDRFDGYVAVNNHMGSRVTRDEAAMKTILSNLKARNVFFIDSLTTGKSVAASAGRAVGERVYARDVFLDPEAGQAEVRKQLAVVEEIARQTGFAVAICHPHKDTLAIVGPWLTSAPARGFKLDTVASLPVIENAWKAHEQVASKRAADSKS